MTNSDQRPARAVPFSRENSNASSFGHEPLAPPPRETPGSEEVDAQRSPAEPDIGSAAKEASEAAKTLVSRIAVLARAASARAQRAVSSAAITAAESRIARGSFVARRYLCLRLQRPLGRAIRSLPPLRLHGVRLGKYALQPRRTARYALAISLAGGLLGFAFVGYCIATLPTDGGLQPEATQSALTLQSDRGEAFATRGVFKGEKLTGQDLPPHLTQSIIAIEDRRFFSHYGIDLRGMLRAAWRNAQAGGTREGGSTITQQLARLMFLSPERTVRRKVQETLVAFWLETQLAKEDILLRYMNSAYFGAGAYGVDAAAKRYFDKRAKDLSLVEAAMLAGLVRAPSQLAPTRNFGGASERAQLVLGAMVETGAITAEQAEAAYALPVVLRTPPETPPGANYFVDMVTSDIRRLMGPASGDATLNTTLNLELQRAAEAVVERRLEAEGAKKKASQAALIAMRPDGAILALVGGRDYEQSQFNRATQAKRQAGSLFKLFVYLTALNKGYTPQSVLVDRPVQIGDWEPQNSTGRFRGAVNLRTAFAQSINTVAAQLAEEVTVEAIIETAKRMGVQSNLPAVPSLALGTADVTLLEMTRAFAAVLAGVETVEPYSVRSINSGSKTFYTRPSAQPPASRLGESRAMMLDLLQTVVAEGTGKAARLPNLKTAGKTGTSQEYRDAWFVGFTPDLVVGVWVGNDDNAPMRNVAGGDMPAAIWRDFVSRASPVLAQRPPPPAQSAAVSGSDGFPFRPPTGAAQPNAAPSAAIRGPARVIDTGTLEIAGRTIRLHGVEGEDGRLARQLGRFLRRREIACEATGAPDVHRCRMGGEDLSELVLAGGAARASGEAGRDLLAAEEQARSMRIGIWRRGRR